MTNLSVIPGHKLKKTDLAKFLPLRLRSETMKRSNVYSSCPVCLDAQISLAKWTLQAYLLCYCFHFLSTPLHFVRIISFLLPHYALVGSLFCNLTRSFSFFRLAYVQMSRYGLLRPTQESQELLLASLRQNENEESTPRVACRVMHGSILAVGFHSSTGKEGHLRGWCGERKAPSLWITRMTQIQSWFCCAMLMGFPRSHYRLVLCGSAGSNINI